MQFRLADPATFKCHLIGQPISWQESEIVLHIGLMDCHIENLPRVIKGSRRLDGCPLVIGRHLRLEHRIVCKIQAAIDIRQRQFPPLHTASHLCVLDIDDAVELLTAWLITDHIAIVPAAIGPLLDNGRHIRDSHLFDRLDRRRKRRKQAVGHLRFFCPCDDCRLLIIDCQIVQLQRAERLDFDITDIDLHAQCFCGH